MPSFQAKTGWVSLKRQKVKIIVPINSYQTRYREFQKKSKKIKIHHYDFPSNQNRLGNAEKERK